MEAQMDSDSVQVEKETLGKVDDIETVEDNVAKDVASANMNNSSAEEIRRLKIQVKHVV